MDSNESKKVKDILRSLFFCSKMKKENRRNEIQKKKQRGFQIDIFRIFFHINLKLNEIKQQSFFFLY